MKSRFWRTLIESFLLSTLIEYAVALCISFYFYKDNQFFYALLIMLALWAIQIALWIKNHVVSYLTYRLVGRRRWIGEVETTLSLQRFPIYEDHYQLMDGADYFARVVEDDSATPVQRNYAAASLGQLALMRTWKPTMAWRLLSVLEAALDDHRRRNSRRPDF